MKMANDCSCCRVLGWLGSIASVISIVIIAFLIGFADRIVEKFMNNNPDKIDYDTVRTAFLAILAAGLMLTAIHLVTSILLIVGSEQKKVLYFVVWLINSLIIYLFIPIIVLKNGGVHSSTPAGVIIKIAIPVLLSPIIEIILWSAIYKLFQMIRARSNAENQILLAGPTAPDYTSLFRIPRRPQHRIRRFRNTSNQR